MILTFSALPCSEPDFQLPNGISRNPPIGGGGGFQCPQTVGYTCQSPPYSSGCTPMSSNTPMAQRSCTNGAWTGSTPTHCQCPGVYLNNL